MKFIRRWRKTKPIVTPCHWHSTIEATTFMFAGNAYTGKWVNVCDDCRDYIDGMKT